MKRNQIRRIIKRKGRKVLCPVCHNEQNARKNCVTCNGRGKVRQLY